MRKSQSRVGVGVLLMLLTLSSMAAGQTVSNVRWSSGGYFGGWCSGLDCLEIRNSEQVMIFEHYINCGGNDVILESSSRSFYYTSACSGSWDCPCEFTGACDGGLSFVKNSVDDTWKVDVEVRNRYRQYLFSECYCGGYDYLETMSWTKVTSEQVCGSARLLHRHFAPVSPATLFAEARARRFGPQLVSTRLTPAPLRSCKKPAPFRFGDTRLTGLPVATSGPVALYVPKRLDGGAWLTPDTRRIEQPPWF